MSELLPLEFNYIKETTHQALEDRYKLLNFYIGLTATVGAVVVTAFSFVGNNIVDAVVISLAALLITMAVVGWVFIVMLIRLRQAWYESIVAMNKIKEYYLQQDKKLKKALHWDSSTIPDPQRLWNIHFYSLLLIDIVSSFFLAAGVGMLLALSLAAETVILICILIFAVSLTILIRSELWALARNK